MAVMEAVCKHCGERIIQTDFLNRKVWTHQPAGATFLDGVHTYCHLTTATPTEEVT